MEFYNRENEIELLEKIRDRSEKSSKMTFIVGRRRIGKTKLLRNVFESSCYLFVSRKNEILLCEEFSRIIEEKLERKIHGKINRFRDLFEFIMECGKNRSFTLIIDEFQELANVNSSIYSDMQNIWDTYKDKTKINLILCGSIYSMMKKIFEGKNEPLFGRADYRIHLKEFAVSDLKRLLTEKYPGHKAYELLAFYIFTGGVPKYVEMFVDNDLFDFDSQLEFIFSSNSLFLDEGKNLLIEEFGKEYMNYFSILSLIASSKTSRTEIESILEKNAGGYLSRMENEYSLIKKIKPVFSKPESRKVKYQIKDNFLHFWFRFIYKNKTAVEIENFNYLKKNVVEHFSTYSGRMLEKYFLEKISNSGEYDVTGTYWERKNLNEIDIVAVNNDKKEILFAEVKLTKNKISISSLRKKSEKLMLKFKDYNAVYEALSLEDM